jgi:signal transduction histidine kinase/CheY-like chemotaxis protein
VKPWISHFSLATKLRLILAGAITATLLLVSVMYTATEITGLHRSLVDRLTTLATATAANAALPLRFSNHTEAQRALDSLRADPTVQAATLSDAQGRVVASFGAAPPPGDAVGLTQAHIEVPVESDGRRLGSMQLEADLTQPFAELHAMLKHAAWALLLAGLVPFVLAWHFAQRIMQPLGSLLNATREALDNKNPEARAERDSDDEFGTLVERFNGLLDELERRDRKLHLYQHDLEKLVRARTLELDVAVAEAREAAKRAQGASRAKSDFLARMSHEIRTPMNGVLGMAELLRHSPTLDERQRRYAITIHQSGSTLLQIINDILDFSKIEAGKLELDVAPFSLRDIIEDAVELLAERAHSKGLELICDLPAQLDLTVCGDGLRLRQVIINLLSNAVKFTEHGEVKVKVRHTDNGLLDSSFDFEVTDTGIGIKPENCSAIFDSFAQEDSSTTRKFGGTGLGLAICKQLVELMGGEIGVSSVVGKGSTFYFSVPLTTDPAAVRDEGRTALTGTRMLVIDDNPTSLRIMREHLESWGVLVKEADSAREAVKIVDKALAGEFEALIVDGEMVLPGGVGLAAAIRSRAEFAEVPLLLISKEPARDASAWLAKPIRRAQLLASLVGLLAPEAAGADAAVNARDPAGARAPSSGRDPASARAPVEARNPASPGARMRAPQSQPNRSSVRRVLLVEDNPVNQEVALAMLHELGVAAESAWSGEEALEKLAADRFEAVLMDCQMPKLDGYAATSRFREWERQHERARTPIVALTANALSGDAERCFAAGMDRYLSKPFTIEQLRDVLESCLPGHGHAAGATGAAGGAGAAGAAGAASAERRPAEPPMLGSGAEEDLDIESVLNMMSNAHAGAAAAPGTGMDTNAAGSAAGPAAGEFSAKKQSVLDEQTLGRIRALHRPGSPDLLTKVVGLYTANSTALTESIRQAALANDAAGLLQAAHALKSSSANVGAVVLADLCRDVETAVGDGQLELACLLVERLLAEHRQVLQALDEQSIAA